MRRRDALALAAMVAVAPAAFAQARVKTVGYLSNGADGAWLARVLATHGHVEGRDLRLEVRVGAGDDKRREEQAAELVRLPVAVLLAFGATNINLLARLTRTIPIVCGGTADPIRIGYAKTLRRPGGNITGLSYGVPEFAAVSGGLMRVILPGMKRIVTIVQARGGNEAERWRPIIGALESAARATGSDWETVGVGNLAELEGLVAGVDRRATFVKIVNMPAEVPGDKIVAALLRHRVACFSAGEELVRKGALLHYSLSHADYQGRVAAIVDKLLRCANPAETPFELPDCTRCVVNRAAAKAIGVNLPAEVLARVTEVIG